MQETKSSQQKRVKVVVQEPSKTTEYHAARSGKERWTQTEVDVKKKPNPNKTLKPTTKTKPKNEEQEICFVKGR